MQKKDIRKLLEERILILDGGLGTMIQGFRLTEADYRGTRFAVHDVPLKGNMDLLNITRPDVICAIQRQFLDAGADIFVTNTFNANGISMDDYGLKYLVREINLEAAKLMRALADDYMHEHPERTVFVAGSIGPTHKSASMSPDADDAAFRAVSYMDLYQAYYEQIDALIDGGVDVIFFETAFDTLNTKAGLDAAVQAIQDKELALPIMLSLTLSGKSGRTFSGQTVKAFLASIQHVPLLSVGLNCSFGATGMKPFLKELAGVAPYYISAYPNAGLPNQFGQYDETPEIMAAKIKEFVDEGLVNIIGGCCGTTPAHIAQLRALLPDGSKEGGRLEWVKPRNPATKPTALWLSGLELLEVKPENNFINIGERCNVAGSHKFLRLIKEKKYDQALAIARKQVDDGAQIIDINMDDGLLDAAHEMKTFLCLIASEPEIARVPVMIDSSKWEVIEQGLMCVQGKSIVNSISLKEGEDEFLERAGRICRLGAAVMVMAFDEKGQADSYERKIEVCARAYKLLTEKTGFQPQDIIFDPNVLAIATGILEHNRYGLDFIRAVGWIKKNLPYSKVSGGVSNLSFALRGNNKVREAMHAVFLYHAIREGMDMGIVNPSSSVTYNEIQYDFRELLEDVVLARRVEAADELIIYAQYNNEPSSGSQETTQNEWREQPIEARIEYALMKGIGDYLEADIHEALKQYSNAVDIINGPLMSSMNRVGALFGEGKMFLPQVIKTARTMKKAVELLQPALEAEKQLKPGEWGKAGKIVFATVKGDVHDIGKNIVSIVLACNNYEVIDLGVMTPAETILKAVKEEKPDLLCLSGLITPSLEEMIHVVCEMQKAGMTIPVMIGGATTSKLHTALKIAPHYTYPVIHVTDASQNPVIAAKLLNTAAREIFINELKKEYENLLSSQPASGEAKKRQERTIPACTLLSVEKKRLFPLSEARKNRLKTDWTTSLRTPAPKQTGSYRISLPMVEVIRYINWRYFFAAWKLEGRYAVFSQLEDSEECLAWLHEQPDVDRSKAEEAWKLYKDAQEFLYRLLELPACCEALYGFFPAVSVDDTIHIKSTAYSMNSSTDRCDVLIGQTGNDIYINNNVTIPVLRQQTPNEKGICLSLADYITPVTAGLDDFIGLYAITSGNMIASSLRQYENDSFMQILMQTISDRLVEAAAEYLHEKVRKTLWGYAPDENLSIDAMHKAHYQGIRPAVGYPSLPDQGLMFKVDQLLHLDRIGIGLTENGALTPSSSVAGFYFAHPESIYFTIGNISEEQLQDYSARSGALTGDVRKFLAKNLITSTNI